jgi:hypothetical protein
MDNMQSLFSESPNCTTNTLGETQPQWFTFVSTFSALMEL